MTERTPDAVRTTIATLRTVAYWLPDADRAHLLETAHTAEVAWDGGCCPVCQETFCDGGCPLEEVRAELYKRETTQVKATAGQAEPCDGRHPLVRPDGTLIYLYDLVAHPDCPHQPWATPEDNGDALGGYAKASRNLAGSLREMANLVDHDSPMEAVLGHIASAAAERLDTPTRVRAILWPSFGGRPAVLCAPCYRTPSGAAVHVRPGCHC